MKCKQKSCKRNQNPNITSGYCNVCDEVAKESIDNVKKKDDSNKHAMKKVDIDYKEMVKLHEKLSKGEVSNPSSANGLILGGIINILIEQGAIEERDDKLKALEEENKTTNARLESLESWNNKQAEEIKKLKYHLEVLDTNGVVVNENEEIKELKVKMTNLDVAIAGLRSTNTSNVQQEVLRNGKTERCNKK